MDAEKRVITVDRHEWVLKSPAHHTEIAKAVNAADAHRVHVSGRSLRVGEIQVAAHDDEVIVSFEAERSKNPKRPGYRGLADEAEASDA